MNVSVEETGPVERCLRIEIPTTEVDAAFEAAFRAIRRSTQIRGFRPGKAPREVLEQQFGEQASGEVLQRLVEGQRRAQQHRHPHDGDEPFHHPLEAGESTRQHERATDQPGAGRTRMDT